MATCNCGEPISELDARLDDLVLAIAQVPDLDGFRVGIEVYEVLLGLVPADAPGAIDAIAVASVWNALADVASQVGIVKGVRANGSS